VAKEKSFTRAAQTMKIGVPLLSKKIARLEEELGVRLFHRSTRKVSLTDDGLSLLPQVTSTLEDLRGLEMKFERKDKIAGTIRVSAGPVIAVRLLAPTITKFTELHPDIKFDLAISDHFVDMVDGQVDVAVRVDEPASSSLIYKKLAPCRMTLVASPKYLKTCDKPLKKPKDLWNHRLLLSPVLEEIRFADGSFSFLDFDDSKKIKADGALVINALALHGAGIALRGVWDVEPYIKSGELVEVLPNHPIENFGDIYAVIPSRRFLSQRVRTFIDFLTQQTRSWN
jgi:DNA-binding transcriptional LysR family regulator